MFLVKVAPGGDEEAEKSAFSHRPRSPPGCEVWQRNWSDQFYADLLTEKCLWSFSLTSLDTRNPPLCFHGADALQQRFWTTWNATLPFSFFFLLFIQILIVVLVLLVELSLGLNLKVYFSWSLAHFIACVRVCVGVTERKRCLAEFCSVFVVLGG